MNIIKPADIQLGNFISVFGKAEMVMGITPDGDNWFVNHTGAFQENNPVANGILLTPEAIPLSFKWLRALRLEHYFFPDDITFVHEAQNYARWVYKAAFNPDFEQIYKLNELNYGAY
jgi:hypothetical protein